jgi:hypothetical protein
MAHFVDRCNNPFTIPGYAVFFLNLPQKDERMASEHTELDQLQNAYKTAVEEWIKVIREEEALASGDHSVAEVDKWEAAHFHEEKAREKAKEAKSAYEDALREKLFGF